MEQSSNLRPPSFPKASRNQNNVTRQRQLKDRLRVNWGNSKPSPMPNEYGIGDGVKGFGENQFNDSIYHEDEVDSSSFLNNPSIYSNAIPPGGGLQQTSIASRRTVSFAPSKTTQQNNPTNTIYSVDSNTVGLNSTTGSTMYLPGSAKLATLRRAQTLPHGSISSNSATSSRNHHHHQPFESHLGLSQSIQEEGEEAGWEHISQSLVSGTAEFCYLHTNPNHHYRFEMQSNFPTDLSSPSTEYATISARGILRVNAHGSELTSFAEITRENNIYCKLLSINLFKTFRVWKTFKSWKAYVKCKHYEERVSHYSLLLSLIVIINHIYIYLYRKQN